jgi:ABC-2 type transport system ATP-binding protein
MLEVVRTAKSYAGRPALVDVDLTVCPGEVVGLLGPNGAGKTTLLSIIAGLLRADAGTVRVNGCDVGEDGLTAQRYLGFAPQSTGLYEPLTVEENLRLFGELAGLRRRRLDGRVAEVCEALLLGELRARRCQQLSGGERRRAHTAVALISQPPLLLLDEPTLGADIETRLALIQLVHDLAQSGSAIVYTTHYLPEVESLDAAVVLIDEGRVVARGPIDRLIAEHGSGQLELRFKGTAPALTVDGLSIHAHGDRLSVSTSTPAPAAARMLNHLGAEIDRLEGVDILRPSLESVFLSLTGRHLADRHSAADAS